MLDKSIFQLNGVKKIFVTLFVMALLQSIFTVFHGIFLAKTISNLFNGEQLRDQLLPLSLFFVFYMSKQVLTLLREKMMLMFSIICGAQIRKELNEKLFQLGPNITSTEGTGNIVTMALEGISQVEKFLKLFLPKILNMLIIPVAIFLYTLTLDTRSAVVLVVVLPTLLFFMVILGVAARKKADKQYESYQVLSNHFVDSLRGLETLRYLGLSKEYDRNIERVSERYRKSTMGTLAVAFLSSFALQFFTSLSVAIVALFLGLGLINGEILLYPALTILILAPEYFSPIRDFGTDYHATLDGKNALSAIQTILNTPNPIIEDREIKLWSTTSTLEISNLTVQHETNHQASLQNIKLTWKGFGKIGVIGASGSGKSTLINVLSGFLQANNIHIEIDGNEHTTFHNKNWQEQLLYIPQKPYIFNDTVANNIAFYTPNASKEEIEKACELAGLTQIVSALPHGLDEEIGEGGHGISGGQEQRIALARAFLDPARKILLFDEPTAHLDIETEWEIKQSIMPLLEKRLVFFATHRLHWMKEMDFILVLERGELVETGTHEELLQNKGAYYKFLQAQINGTEVSHGE